MSIDLDHVLETLGPRFAERIDALDDADAFAAENYAELKAARVFSALVPEALGGGGASHAGMCAFLRRLARHCSSTALALSMHQHLVAAAVANHRAGRPGRRLLETVARGEAVLVSTGANDWLESNGRAERVAGGWRVSAVKPFASGAPAASAFVTSVAREDPEAGPEVLHFPVPADAEGVVRLDDWRSLGMRATGSHTVRFEGVFVPDEAVALRRPRGPWHPAFAVIVTAALPLILSAYLGAAEAAGARALARARDRRDDPATWILAGELEARLTAARLACDDMVRIANDLDFEATDATADAILVRKSLAANAVLAAAEKALELAGGAGFLRRTGIERLLRDVHGAQFHPLPEKRQQGFTGRRALGLAPVAGPAAAADLAAE